MTHSDFRAHASAAPVVPFFRANVSTLPAAPDRSACSGCRLRPDCIATAAGELAQEGSPQLLIGRRRLRRGEVLFREGHPFGYLYAVRFGTFKGAFTLDDGREQVTDFFFAGDVLGFDGFGRRRHSTFATALEDSEVCSISCDELMQLAPAARGEAPAAVVARVASAELLRDHAGKAITSLRLADPRVAAFLLMLSGRMRASGQSATDFELRMTRAEIGSYLGLTLESVSRAFSFFAQEGWIRVNKRSLSILSVRPLQKLCGPAVWAVQEQCCPDPGDEVVLAA